MMSEPAVPTPGGHAETGHAVAGHAEQLATPAASVDPFNRSDITSFSRDDSEAVTAISKMLVGFFFYSLLVMAGVTIFAAMSWL